MSLSGRLADSPLPLVLQTLAQRRLSGRLTVTCEQGQAIFLLREGRLICAASTSARETLGNILVAERRITAEQLTAALEKQHSSTEERRLGAVLVEMGVVSDDDLTRVLRDQALRVVKEAVEWADGFYRFEAARFEERGEVSIDLSDYLLEEGLRMDHALIGAATLPDFDELPAGDGQSEVASAELDSMAVQSLRTAMLQVTQPTFEAESTLAVLDYAGQLADRVVLLICSPEYVQGMAQVGLESVLESSSAEERVRALHLPLDQPSIFLEAIQRRETVQGPLDESEVHTALLDCIGGQPAEAVVIPMIVQNGVAFLLYCDVDVGSIRSLVTLEAVVMQTALAMENAMLERRLAAMEEQQQLARAQAAQAQTEPAQAEPARAEPIQAEEQSAATAEPPAPTTSEPSPASPQPPKEPSAPQPSADVPDENNVAARARISQLLGD